MGPIISYSVGPYPGKGTGETSLFSQMIGSVAKNDLLLADRYYCTWAIIALLLQPGSHILMLNHAQRKPDFRLGKRLAAKGHIVEGKNPSENPTGSTIMTRMRYPIKYGSGRSLLRLKSM